jgi:hypothetical protein
MVTKDFKENDTGLEYIGTNRQQMGDAGFIAQIKDTSTGKVVAATSTKWRGLVIHQAPTNKECATSPTPATVCKAIMGTQRGAMADTRRTVPWHPRRSVPLQSSTLDP